MTPTDQLKTKRERGKTPEPPRPAFVSPSPLSGSGDPSMAATCGNNAKSKRITLRPLPPANARDNPNFTDSLLAPARSSNMSYAVSDPLPAIAQIPAKDGRARGPGAPNHAFLFSAKPE